MVTEKFRNEQVLIKEFLSDHPDGMSIRQITRMLGINRNTVAKYLDMLQVQGRVTVRRIGAAKIYSLENRLPAETVLRLAETGVVLFGHDMAVIDINDTLTDYVQAAREDIVGKKAGNLPFTVQCDPNLFSLVREGLKGTETRLPAHIVTATQSLPGMINASPVFFENGNPGVALRIELLSERAGGRSVQKESGTLHPEPDGLEFICQFDPHGTLTFVNTAYCTMAQKSRSDLIGRKWRPVTSETECRKIRESFSALDRANPQVSHDVRVITKSGESQWQRWKIRGIFDEQGRIRHFQASGLDITDGKRAEEKLVAKQHQLEALVREHEEEIRDLNRQLYHEISSREKADFQLQFTQFAMNNASYLIIWIDRDGRFIYINKKAHEYLGYSYRELLTKNLFDFFPRDLKDTWDVKWETIRRERHVTFESMLKTGNGQDIPVEMVLNFLEFKEKPYCCCFIADISDRREAKRALEEREKQYRILFEGTAEGILVADIATRRFLHANPAICRMLGYTGQEFLAMSVDDIHPAEDLAAVFAEFDAQVRGEKEVAAALPCLRKDGTILYADVVASPVLMNGIHCLVGFFLDVTDRRNAQKALTRSRHELASIIDHLPDATFVINREGTVIAWNRAIETMTGVKAEDILGKGDHEYAIPFYGTRRSLLADIVLKPDSQMEARDYTLLHKEGDLLIAESNLPRLKGKDSSLWAKATPVYDENGEKIAAIESIRDITDRRNAEQALRESEARYRSLIENLPQRIFIKDKNSVYISCNNNYAADLKILPEEIAGMTDYDFYPQELADKYRVDDQRLIESGQTEEIVEEYQIQGEKTRVRTIKTPIRDVHGNRIGIIGIFWKVS